MLASSGDYVLETKVIIGQNEYTEISAPIIDRALCKDTIEVGNCISASLTVSIRTNDTFSPGAAVEVQKRIWNGGKETSSEWLTAGTFYISKRQKDYASGLVSLTCYDAMLKGSEKFFQDDPNVDLTGWPHSMSDVVTYIAGRMGVQIDSRTTLRTESRYQITATPQGTLLDVLGHIGACMGGNWTITPEGKLRLVQLTTAPTQTDRRANRVQAQTELGETYLRWSAVDSNNTEHYGEWGLENGYIVLVDDDPDPITDAEITAVLSRLGTSDAITITGISMSDDLESVTYTAGTTTGYQLVITGNPYCSQEICNDLLTTLGGIEYHPFNADKAIYDPAAELGDPVMYKDIYYSILMTEKATLNVAFRSDIGAPANREIEDEYPYKNPAQKNYEKAASMANNARKEAINYLARDDTGIMVAKMDDDNRYTPSEVPTGVKNTYIDDDSFEVRDGQKVLARFGQTGQVGPEDGSHLVTDDSGIQGINGDGITVFDISMDGGYTLVRERWTWKNTPKTIRDNTDNVYQPKKITNHEPVSGTSKTLVLKYEIYNSSDWQMRSVTKTYNFPVAGGGSMYIENLIAQDSPLISIGKMGIEYTGTHGVRVTVTLNDAALHGGYYITIYGMRYEFSTSVDAPAFSLGTRADSSHGGFSGIVGVGLSASHPYQFACGKYNADDSAYAFMVGNGSEDGDSNAFAVTWDGDILMALDEEAASGTTDAKLYDAITALGWEEEVLV